MHSATDSEKLMVWLFGVGEARGYFFLSFAQEFIYVLCDGIDKSKLMTPGFKEFSHEEFQIIRRREFVSRRLRIDLSY